MARKIFLICFMACAALTAGVFLHQTVLYNPEGGLERPLAEALPLSPGNWVSYERELANTPEQQRNVESILQYTDAVFREYRKGPYEIGVYVAYWAPKTMPVRMVQAHTPDICWVLNGWAIDGREEAVILEHNGTELKPAEYRYMVVPSHNVGAHVYYWHIVGDHVYTTRIVGTWDRWDPIKSVFRFGLNQRTEQFFVRISSNLPFDAIWDDPGFQEIMGSLESLALRRSQTPQG